MVTFEFGLVSGTEAIPAMRLSNSSVSILVVVSMTCSKFNPLNSTHRCEFCNKVSEHWTSLTKEKDLLELNCAECNYSCNTENSGRSDINQHIDTRSVCFPSLVPK